MLDGLSVLHWFSIIAPTVAVLGVGGMVALMIFAPAVYVVALKILKDALDAVLSTRIGCAGLAVLVAAPLAYWGGVWDRSNRDALERAGAQAVFAHKLAGAARVAAANDQDRAAAAEARASQAEEEAHALAAQVPNMACFAPADTDRLRGLWPAAPRKARAAARARSIPDLLRRKDGPAAGGAADQPAAVRPGGGTQSGR